MKNFTEFYKLRWFAREIADGPFSYLWCGTRRTVHYPIDLYVNDSRADSWRA